LITKTASNYKVKNFDELILALQKLKENSGRLTLPEGKSQLIDSGTASLMLQLNDKLTDPNIRPKFEADIMTWAGFLRLANFAWGKSSFNKGGSLKKLNNIVKDIVTLAGNYYPEGFPSDLKEMAESGHILGATPEYDEQTHGTGFGGLLRKWQQNKTTPEEELKLFNEINDYPDNESLMDLPMLHRMNELMQEGKIKPKTTVQSIKKVLQRLLKTSTDELGGIHDIDFAQWEGDGVDEETDAINMQKMISSGQAWTMQGSYGRSAMQYLEAGMCMLGKEGHNDYYGNYVPSRTEVKAGTKGSEALCKKNYPDLYKKYIKLGL